MSGDDSTRDPSTGLLHRAAFLAEVRASQSKASSQVRRGCLLILHFPVLKEIASQGGNTAAVEALHHLLGVVETRLRSRDTLGRIGEHSLCILLRQCLEANALIIADQYVALLRDVVIDTGGFRAPMDLLYRVVALDARGNRPRQGLSRLVKAPAISDTSRLLSSLSQQSRALDTEANKIIPFKRHSSAGSSVSHSADKHTPARVTRLPDTTVLPIQLISEQQASRLKPGLMLKHRPLVCCYRMHPVSTAPSGESLQTNKQIHAALGMLSLAFERTKPLVDNQIIVTIDAAQLSIQSASWLRDQCRELRITTSDVCLAVHVDSLNHELRARLPALRRLNRLGIRVMLEGLRSAVQFAALKNLAVFDYLMISGRMVHASMDTVRIRQEMAILIEQARAQRCEICATGIDSPVLLSHAQSMDIDIGFGRQCGKSLPFPKR